MLRSLLALAACSAVVGWRAAPPRYALHAYKARRRRARALPTLYAAAKAEGGGAEVVVKEAARLLRDGHRDDALVRASKQILELVSPQNNAATLNANAFARSVETHRAHYGPLLTWHAFDVTSCDTSKDGLRCVVRCVLAGDAARQLGTAVWTLSRHDERWLIDAVLVQPASEAAALEPVVAAKPPPPTMKEKLQAAVDAPPPEREPVAKPNPLAGAGATSFGALTSPRWVAKTVLSALRTIDDPAPNHGSTVALTFVSQKNPASKLTPELFRKYIDDETYPYGVLTRWVDMEPDQVTFDEEKRKAVSDVTLIDEDGSERLVTIELSKSDDVAPWRIDKFWCEEAY
jgi:hypothetical protein